jgi:hypothetical protein
MEDNYIEKNYMENDSKEDDNEIIKISKWKTPATDYPEKQVGSARIKHGFYNYGYFNNYGVRGYKCFEVTEQIPVTSLEIKDDKSKIWRTWMVDDPPHWWSMQDYARNSVGKVLVAGLGLGLVTHELLNNIDVDSMTVIERNKDVIDLIFPLLPKAEGVKFQIINKDFYDFIHESEEDFDRIIVDLWTSGSKEETKKILDEEVKPLVYYLKLRYPNASIIFHGFGISL